ncbi:PREDICTED: trichohyalin [Atta cephalotes]|uniref:Sfi1 spindle body domain-containing protein n=1 Tax=Atta cephalotes TaxID=12957 RepID=A0A158NZB3_ATTCE|nr:PREDICTED: trichohyalin [Atta cephalotes]
MDEMMKVTIFEPSEKRRMLEDERKTFLDPNVVMNARHRIFRELASSPAKSSVLAEARRLLTQEKMKELQMKREQAFIQRELRKFEQDLQKSRPKFCGLCSRKNIASSDDENFWKTSSRVKRILINKRRNKQIEQKPIVTQKKNKKPIAEVSSTESKDSKRCSTNEIEIAPFGNIKVTIKDKPNYESEEQRLNILRSYFEALRKNARDKRRLYEIMTRIQTILSQRKLKSYIHIWKMHVKKVKAQREQAAKNPDIPKIELLVDTIKEVQKELKSNHRTKPKDPPSNSRNPESLKKKFPPKPFIVESPTQCRLNAQKEIIRKQRMKLAEQNKIIEELKLKQVQEAIMRSGEETVNVAKETLTHCGQQTRRSLIQLMRQAGYRDKSLIAPVRVPSPPKFLARMEARAEARRDRIKLREEARRKKLEDEKRKEEVARRAEEQERKRLQQEASREARRMREERERQRAYEVERCKKLNAIAEAFYRKYLLRRYITALIEKKNNDMKKADDYYKRCLLRKIFMMWRMETERQNNVKFELATSLYNRNLLRYGLQKWKEILKEERRKDQVARDFCDMRLQNKYFKMWKIKMIECKVEELKREHLALQYYEKKLKIKYFNIWKRYPEMIPVILERKRLRNMWREIVQEIIPDFDPRQRGVILED